MANALDTDNIRELASEDRERARQDREDRPLLDIGCVLRRTLSEAMALDAIGSRTIKPYANAIILLAEKGIELDEQREKEWASQRADAAIQITRQCRDLLSMDSPGWKLLDERLTALASPPVQESGEIDPPSRMRPSSF